MRLSHAVVLLAVACNPSPTTRGGAIASAASSTTVPVLPASVPAIEPTAGPSAVRMVPALSDTDALTLVRTKRLEAKADGRVLVVYVGATWCEPCKRFKRELDSGRLDARLGKVTLLAFDADKDVDRLGAAGYSFKFVPFVALPGPDGRPAESAQATGKGSEAWRELLDKLDAWQR